MTALALTVMSHCLRSSGKERQRKGSKDHRRPKTLDMCDDVPVNPWLCEKDWFTILYGYTMSTK